LGNRARDFEGAEQFLNPTVGGVDAVGSDEFPDAGEILVRIRA
jgi:hypothetical protein